MSPALRVLHEDSRLLAVDKPSGRLVIPDRAGAPDCLRADAEKALGRKLFVVHRLDREASGLVLFAKDAECHRHLSAQFESRKVKKRYLALVRGALAGAGVIDKPLRRFGSGRMGVDPRGKPSVTRYSVAAARGDKTLLEAFPETGRQHQLRVHLYSIGHPIVGDPLYGKIKPEGRLMLHAVGLELLGCDGALLRLACEPGEDFA